MAVEIELEPHEARVLGVLVEKELTTPEQYPLSLNALTAGCNQKSNRDPVLELLESDVYEALQRLIRRGLVGAIHPAGGRVEKFRHNAAPALELAAPQVAILAELLLRGPQQPGELRSHVARMTPVDSLAALSDLLQPLIARGLVVRLDPAPGSRAERYAQRLAPDAHPAAAAPATSPRAAAESLQREVQARRESREDPRLDEHEKRLAELEGGVARLRRQLEALAWRLGEKLDA